MAMPDNVELREVWIDTGELDDEGNPRLKKGVQLVIDGYPIGPAYSSPAEFDEIRVWLNTVLKDSEDLDNLKLVIYCRLEQQ